MPVEEIKRLGRATQGVIVMRLRGDERVSSIAPVVEADTNGDGLVGANGDGDNPHDVELLDAADELNGSGEPDELDETDDV
jgi:hypothetical protein